MSSVEGFVSSVPVPISAVAESLQLMRRSHPKGHDGEFGTELGLLIEGEVSAPPSNMVCHTLLSFGGRTFTQILTRAENKKGVEEVIQELGILGVETKTLLAAQTRADFPIDGIYKNTDSNLVVNDNLSLAVCGYITWVLENTNEGRVRKNIENFGSGRDAHVFAGWVQDVGIKKAFTIPTTTRCVALDSNGRLHAFRRDGRSDGYVHPRPGIFMCQDAENLFVASTTVKALELLIGGHPSLQRKIIRTVKDMEVVSSPT